MTKLTDPDEIAKAWHIKPSVLREWMNEEGIDSISYDPDYWPESMLTTREAATMLGIKPETLTRWIRANRCGIAKVSFKFSHYRFFKHKLEDWARKNKEVLPQGTTSF